MSINTTCKKRMSLVSACIVFCGDQRPGADLLLGNLYNASKTYFGKKMVQ